MNAAESCPKCDEKLQLHQAIGHAEVRVCPACPWFAIVERGGVK